MQLMRSSFVGIMGIFNQQLRINSYIWLTKALKDTVMAKLAQV